MPQELLQTEGVVLRALPFQDYDQIVTLFTPQEGLMTLIDKGARRKSCSWTPLTQVEVVYRESRGSLCKCWEKRVVDPFPALRERLSSLEAGCDLLQGLIASQMAGKAAPALYALLCYYLKKMPHTPDPWILALSFRLKLLRHDGWIAVPFTCTACQAMLEERAYLLDGTLWCSEHRPRASICWEAVELALLYRLATCRHYAEISGDTLPLNLKEEVTRFFLVHIK